MNRISLCLLALVFFTSSCSIFKKNRKNNIPIETSVYKSILANNYSEKYLSAKARMKASFGESSQSFTTNFRFEKDKVIWGSASAFSIEVARFLITPDSIFLMDRFNQKYLAEPFSYLYEYTKTEVTFIQLQDLLLGNLNEGLVLNTKPESSLLGILLSGTNSDFDYRILCDDKNYKVLNYTFQQKEQNLEFAVSYSDFSPLGNSQVAQQVLIRSKSPDGEAEININFVKLEREESLSFPYKVPEKYEQIR